MATGSGDRGKLAEKKAKAFFSALTLSATSAFMRLPDAHAGSMVATLADYMLMIDGKFILAEVKSTRHEYRLPHGNFGPDQVARMRVWELAGATCIVLVYHETLDLWRSTALSYFRVRDGGSWDLRDLPTQSLKEAFYKGISNVQSDSPE